MQEERGRERERARERGEREEEKGKGQRGKKEGKRGKKRRQTHMSCTCREAAISARDIYNPGNPFTSY